MSLFRMLPGCVVFTSPVLPLGVSVKHIKGKTLEGEMT